MKATKYAVCEGIARTLHLVEYRRTDGKGMYLLSSMDLRCYGIERAIDEGAIPLSDKEAKDMFNL